MPTIKEGVIMSEVTVIFALISIWMSILITLVILFGAVVALIKGIKDVSPMKKEKLEKYPKVTIVVPAHNEELVIQDTVAALMALDYPKESLEIRIVADNCSDKTFEVANEIIKRNKTKALDI